MGKDCAAASNTYNYMLVTLVLTCCVSYLTEITKNELVSDPQHKCIYLFSK